MYHLDITVTNTTVSTALRPVTGGVPIAKGAAPKGSHFTLTDQREKPVPCQSGVTAKWPDGSARWVLLDFQSAPRANQKLEYRLCWGGGEENPLPLNPVAARGGKAFLLDSGSVKIRPAARALFEIDGIGVVEFVAVDPEGRACSGEVESAKVETRGPMRSTLVLAGSFRRADGGRLFGFRTWVSVYAGLSKTLVEPMVLMDAEKGVVQRFRELSLRLRPSVPVVSGCIGGEPGWDGTGRVRMLQIDDQQYVIEEANRKGFRAPGWAEITTGNVRAAVAVRDFWQQWPKSLEAGPDGVKVGLFPRFEAGAFDHMFDPWYKHDYLFDGDCYRLRTGQVRRWHVWFDFEGGGSGLAEQANAPLVPAADPAEALRTGVFGEVLPKGADGMQEYDGWVSSAYDGYVKAIDDSRDYGAMNWGDWFGERRCNWGNEEYDGPRQFMLEFARSGEPRFLHTGGAAARHNSEVDIIHFVNPDLENYFTDEVCRSYTNRSIIDNYPIRPGMNHAHCVGHVGGFHSVEQIRLLYLEIQGTKYGNPYLCLDPYCISHVFTQGMTWYYFFTGDPWVRETIVRVADNLSRLVLDRKFPFTGRPCAGRELGWPLLAIAAAYELDYNRRYMDAMRILAEDALAEQDPNCGGWLQELSGGHCSCVKRHHIGEAGFITSIRLNALYRYYRLSGDRRIPECIRRGVDNMNADLWRDELSGWRYTSCPASFHFNQPGVTMMTMVNVVRMLDDHEHRRILAKAWDALFNERSGQSPRGVGKAFGSGVYGLAEAASALAEPKKRRAKCLQK